MYNTNQYNTALYNAQSQLFDLQIVQDDIVFNGFSLQNSNIITSQVTHDNVPTRDFKTFKIPRGHGEGITSDFYRRKTITLNGVIKGSSNADLNNRIDELKKETSGLNGNLDIKINGVIRRFKATMVLANIIDRKNFHVTFVPFRLTFSVVLPFGQDVDATFIEIFGVTQLDIITQIENEGTASVDPLFTLILAAANAITSISLENETTGEKITIASTYSSSDVLQVNSSTKTVTINGAITDYLGVFPSLDLDVNRINIILTGTSAVYSFTTKFLKTYL